MNARLATLCVVRDTIDLLGSDSVLVVLEAQRVQDLAGRELPHVTALGGPDHLGQDHAHQDRRVRHPAPAPRRLDPKQDLALGPGIREQIQRSHAQVAREAVQSGLVLQHAP